MAALGDLVAPILRPDPVQSQAYFGARLGRSARGVLVGQPKNNHRTYDDCSASKVYEFGLDGQLIREIAAPGPQCHAGLAVIGTARYIFSTRLTAYDDPAMCGNGGGVDVFDAYSGIYLTTLLNIQPSGLPQERIFAQNFGGAIAPIRTSTIAVSSPGSEQMVQDYVTRWNVETATRDMLLDQNAMHYYLNPGEGFGASLDASPQWILAGAPMAQTVNGDPTTAVTTGCADVEPDQLIDYVGFPYVLAFYTYSGGHPIPGKAYLFDASGTLVRDFESPSPSDGDAFGYSVAVVGDYAIVGAPYDDGAGTDAGAVFIFALTDGHLVGTLHSPNPSPGARFGWALDTAGDLLAVSEPWSPFDESVLGVAFHTPGAGVVHVFSLADRSLVRTIQNPSSQKLNDRFGSAIAVSRNRLVVSALLEDANQDVDGGIGWIYDLGPLIDRVSLRPEAPSQVWALFNGAVSPGGMDVHLGNVVIAGQLQGAFYGDGDSPVPPASLYPPANSDAWRLTFDGSTSGPDSVTVAYDATGLAFPESTLALAFLPSGSVPPESTSWVVGGAVDAVNHAVSMEIPSLSGWLYLTRRDGVVTSVPEAGAVPGRVRLGPNPMTQALSIRFDLVSSGHADARIFRVDGSLVRSLIDSDLPAGKHELAWDGKDSMGQSVPAGTYFCRLRAPGLTRVQKLTLVR